MNDEQVIQSLRNGGADYKDIADALAQSRIKAAVEQQDADPNSIYPGEPTVGTQNEMEPSMMGQQQEMMLPSPGAAEYPSQIPAPSYDAPQGYDQQQYGEQYVQQPYGTSPDMTAEIAEQVVAEKLGELRKHLEKIADMKTIFDSKVEILDERLRRIEKTIDVLQSSVLRKVGDYVTNVEDIKREMIETQKTFSKLIPEHRAQHSAPEHHKSPHEHNQSHHQHHN